MTDGLDPPEARERALYARFEDLGIAWSTVAHPPVFAVTEARALRGCITGCHTKNLFLKDRKEGLWLVVLREELALDLTALARQLSAPRFSFGPSGLMAELLGVPPGAVTPFALMNDVRARVRAVLDAKMLSEELLNFHPLRNDRTTTISTADLLKFLEACGHAPIIATLPEREGSASS